MPRPRNLCCGYSLRQGTAAIGYSDIFVQAAGIIIYVIVLFTHSEKLACILDELDNHHDKPFFPPVPASYNCSEILENTTQLHEIAAISASSGSLLIRFIELIIAVVLVRGAQTRSERKVNIWVLLTTVLTVLDAGTFGGTVFIEQNKMVMGYAISTLAYKLYALGVVKSYDTQLRSQYYGGADSEQRPIYNGE